MPQVSKYPIAQDVYNRIFEIFFKTLVGIKDTNEVKEFVEDFLTPTEQIMLAKRLAIAVLLFKKYDYRSIAKILRVSPTTIASVNIFLKYKGKGYRRVVKKILAVEKRDEFWNKLDDLLSDIVPPKGRNWYYWRKEREGVKRKRKKPF